MCALEKVNVKNTKSDIKACHWMGDVRKTIVRFLSRKHSFDVLNNKKMIISADLSSVGFDNSTNLYFTQNLSDYNNKAAFHCRELRRRKLIIQRGHIPKVLIKVQDNGDEEEIKHLIQLITKFPNHNFNFNY